MKNGEDNDFLDRDMIEKQQNICDIGFDRKEKMGVNWMIISVGLSRMRSVLGS